MKRMKVLGIETSCDETAVCLIEAFGDLPKGEESNFKYRVLGNALISQAALHSQYGGVFPNLAKREHAKNLVPLLIDALRQADELKEGHTQHSADLREMLAREPDLYVMLEEFFAQHGKPTIDCIAVTYGPGLEPALWVGINFAKALSKAWNIPIVAVNHMEGHIVMPLVESPHSDWAKMRAFDFPSLALLISGGHTELILAKGFGSYERLGETRDDAAGEAFDKIARLLDLPYPGGPEIARLAAIAREQNIIAPQKLTRPMLHDGTYDFSFAGLKTAVRRIVEENSPLSDSTKKGIAREVEEAICDVLAIKTMRAAEERSARTIVLGGGVSANQFVRERLVIDAAQADLQLLVTSLDLSTDNALMIALAGYLRAARGQFADPTTLKAEGHLRL
jgi:N6-L-threonylcarbamoyladenine synthase